MRVDVGSSVRRFVGRPEPCLAFLAAITLTSPPASAQQPCTMQVKIFRDLRGIGHVYAPTEEALFYGLGRLHARDKPLDTMMKLTWAAGLLAPTLGLSQEISVPPWPAPHPIEGLFVNLDRKIRANKIPERAQALFATYCSSPAGSEGAALCAILKAYVQGIRDELAATNLQHLAGFYFDRAIAGDWPYYGFYRLSQAQYLRLLGRTPTCWEPIAAMLYGLGGVALGQEPDPYPFTQFGSNSWGVSAWGSAPEPATGPTFVQIDPHAGPGSYQVVRLKSTAPGGLDCGGFTEPGIPFVLGGFSNHVAWSTHYLIGMDMVDDLQYMAKIDGPTTSWYIDENDTSCNVRALHSETLTITPYGQSPLVYTEYYLDPISANPGNSPLWVAKKDVVASTCSAATHKIVASRAAGLEDGASMDHRWDSPRMIYRMLKATSTENLIATAFQGVNSGFPLGHVIGSDFDPTLTPTGPMPSGPGQGPQGPPPESNPQLAYLSFARVPRRPSDNQLTVAYTYTTPMSQTTGLGTPRQWTTQAGRMFYETTSFPIHRAHVPNHPTYQQHTRFLAGCNTSQQWCQGRNVPFPGVDPDEWNPEIGAVHPSYGMGGYQFPTWYTDFSSYGDWVFYQTPATITASFAGTYLGILLTNTAGALTVRQEWAINKLRRAYEPHPGAITESELRGLILDRQDPHAHYLAYLVHPDYQRTWFDDLIVHHPAATSPPEYDLLLEFKSWAEGGAQLTADSGTPAKWHIFWYYFREDVDSPLNQEAPVDVRGFLYNFPSIQAYQFASQYSYVLNAANRALTLTLDALQYHPNLRLQDMLYVRVPFTNSLYPTTGSYDTLRTAWLGAWTTQPGTAQVPRRPIVGGSRCAMLVRLYQSEEETHTVYVSNFGVVADDESLPEWQVDQGVRYRASIQNWAQGIDYLLPMTELALQGESAPCYSFDYPYSSPPPCP